MTSQNINKFIKRIWIVVFATVVFLTLAIECINSSAHGFDSKAFEAQLPSAAFESLKSEHFASSKSTNRKFGMTERWKSELRKFKVWNSNFASADMKAFHNETQFKSANNRLDPIGTGGCRSNCQFGWLLNFSTERNSNRSDETFIVESYLNFRIQ